MSRPRVLLIVFLGALVMLIGFVIIRNSLSRVVAPPPTPTLPPPLTSPVLITTRAIPVRGILGAQDVKLIEIPIALVPPGAVNNKNNALGQITTIPLAAGEMVLAHHLARPTFTAHDLAFTISNDQVIMALPPNDLMSQLNILKPGDLIDILVSLEVPVLADQSSGAIGFNNGQESQSTLFTFDALQHLTIQAMVVRVIPSTQRPASPTRTPTGPGPQGTPLPTSTPVPPEVETQAIMLALSPQDALVLKHIVDSGGIWDIVLRSPTASQLYELEPVMPNYIKDRYELDKGR